MHAWGPRESYLLARRPCAGNRGPLIPTGALFSEVWCAVLVLARTSAWMWSWSCTRPAGSPLSGSPLSLRVLDDHGFIGMDMEAYTALPEAPAQGASQPSGPSSPTSSDELLGTVPPLHYYAFKGKHISHACLRASRRSLPARELCASKHEVVPARQGLESRTGSLCCALLARAFFPSKHDVGGPFFIALSWWFLLSAAALLLCCR